MHLHEMKKKIAILSPLGYSGLAYYDYSLCQSLAKQGCLVELCTSDRWILKQKEKAFKCRYYYKKCSGPTSKLRKGVNYFLSLNRVWRYIDKNKIAMVHYQIPELPILDMLLFQKLKKNNIPIIFTPHDVNHNKDILFSRKGMERLYKYANVIVALNTTSKEKIIKLYNVEEEKVVIIPHGNYSYFISNMPVIEARMRLAIPVNRFVILYFGNLTHSKGIHLFLQSLKYLKKRKADIFVLIAGRPEAGLCENAVRHIISDAGFEDSARLDFGFVPENRASMYYFAANLVVLPYLNISESGVLRYAHSCGRATLCSSLPSFQEQIQEGVNGFLFNHDRDEDLALAILKIMEGNKCEHVGLQAKKISDTTYSWDMIAKNTLALYDNVNLEYERKKWKLV